MGIPSYYKRLASSIKTLVVPHRAPIAAGALLFDFNCMIYQVIRDKSLRPFPGYGDTEGALAWENEVCQAIVDYTLKVWREVGKPTRVFIGVDGVVPMAKIRQQRLRRFKSIWMAREEETRSLRPVDPNRWDTNAITPGTAFMERLGARLRQLCQVQGWTVSDASEPGEGEQKCMDYWRRGAAGAIGKGDIVVYGLDADLILLCLLTRQMLGDLRSVWLFREATEWESGSVGGEGQAPFMRFSVNSLSDSLVPAGTDSLAWTLDYVAAMSLLGNDFVPHSLSIKIRENGHQLLVSSLRRIHSAGLRLVTGAPGSLTYDAVVLHELITPWAADEQQMLLAAIKHKGQRTNFEDWNLLPTVWRVEEKTLCESRGVLHADWQQRMLSSWFGEGVTGPMVCKKYCEGLQWILDYYTAQRPIDPLWVYPWSLPPTWSMLVAAQLEFPTTWSDGLDLKPQEQLAMVLPKESWHFIRDAHLRELPEKAPQFWPRAFSFFSAGRFFLWECEPEIPLLFLPVVRALSKS
jgi:5'-3' exonuclease